MPQRRVEIPGIGEVLLAKRRGARNLRLSITAKGVVRVSMPSWAPYAAGISFARSRADWITEHLQGYEQVLLREGMLIGKAHRLHFRFAKINGCRTRVTATTVEIVSGYGFNDPRVQAKAVKACERALKAEAENLLPQRLDVLAAKYGYEYKQTRVRKLTSRWGSCSRDKVISLSYYLMQLPWPLIDYVLVHELTHTRHLNHGPDFWTSMKSDLGDVKAMRREIRLHKPRLLPG